MISTNCPVCGGKLNIRIGAEIAVCDSCGNVSELDHAEVAKLRIIYKVAKNNMSRNTADGYREAIRKLDMISFVDEASELRKECEHKLSELQEGMARRQEFEKASEKKSALLGIILIVVILLLCVGALATGVYFFIRLVNGTLSRTAAAIFIGVAALVILLIFTKRSG